MCLLNMKFNKSLDLTTSNHLRYTLNGIGWLLYSFFSLFDNLICSIMSTITLLICIISCLICYVIISEPEDEMSQHNMTKAKAAAMDNIKLVILYVLVGTFSLALLSQFIPVLTDIIDPKFSFAFTMMLGISDIEIGHFFAKYEKDGE